MFKKSFSDDLQKELREMEAAGTYKTEAAFSGPQGAIVSLKGKDVLNLCANDYLGLSNHPELVEVSKKALEKYGLGMASVRFIAGTTDLHEELEEETSRFFGAESTILYSSCFEANTGFFETLLQEGDGVFSDELNHASIIDGIRLSKAARFRYPHKNMQALEEELVKGGATTRRKIIATDGVFSMDGTVAPLGELAKLGEKYEALLMVDDSHGSGVLGERGRGSAEGLLAEGSVDVVTSTFGKALGGAGGGFAAGKKEIIEYLRQKSRPYIFSNTLAPSIAAAALYVLKNFDRLTAERRVALLKNTLYFRKKMTEAGFVLSGDLHPITPVMIPSEVASAALAKALFSRGIYVRSFAYPVVPKGKARIRVQLSATHTEPMLDTAVVAFIEEGRTLGIV